MYNSLTIDVEDYYMVSGFADVIKFEDWPQFESRIQRSTDTILKLLAEHKVKATFFILGWVAENYPDTVRDIHVAGHEVACHGYNHRLIYDLTPKQFGEDIRKAKMILEDITGAPVIGYRAASYSIIETTLWALDVLIDEGFLYDSSIFPIHHDRYGFPQAARFPHTIERKRGIITEFPPSTCRVFGQNIPIAGGGYLRLFPFPFIRAAVKRINEIEKKPVILYIHPWEIDTNQPRIHGRRLACMRHYMNLSSTMSKLTSILTMSKFQPLSMFLEPPAELIKNDI